LIANAENTTKNIFYGNNYYLVNKPYNAMLSQPYPSLLKPTDIELFVLNNETFEIPKCILTFKQWEGLPIANTFGGKPLIDFDGTPMFAELALMKLFKIAGWNSRWIETYGAKATVPYHFSDWIDGKLTEQPIDLIQEEHILAKLNEISLINKGTYSGCWDVLGWLNDKMVFAELKRTKKDRIRNTQCNWLSSCMAYGLTIDNFLIVQWDFI